MSDRILCKFFVHGSCLKGENCEYSHDSKNPVNNVCTFYQKGICLYGSRCRYHHVTTTPASNLPPSPPLTSDSESESTNLQQQDNNDIEKSSNVYCIHPREYPICSFCCSW
ncbi:E3 ubiquitin-protein ligase makorin [Cardamine amara subsp. amara]|uniref:E3 ubiquitin-protein ligase makorin n=1 Tax=Cardamine amara subsp. amara TaxID=228776 RepID=A0ABD1BXF1_CARAN